MKRSHSIRDLFSPIQPWIKPGEDQIVYVEYPPDLRLVPYIYCYWQLTTRHPLGSPFTYRVVSDGCIDILWDATSPQWICITGFSNRYTEFHLEPSFCYYGIRFLPTAFPLLFNIPASELTNRFEDLDIVAPQLYKWILHRIEDKGSFEEIRKELDLLFLDCHRIHASELDSRLYDSMKIMLLKKGNIIIEKELDTGLSPRQLRRLFDFYIGDSPKAFSKVIRFQTVLNQNPTLDGIRENKIYFDLGYFDQSHFIKDFKNFYGLPPSRAFE